MGLDVPLMFPRLCPKMITDVSDLASTSTRQRCPGPTGLYNRREGEVSPASG